MESKKIICILLGDSRVGKTSLLKTYLEGKFPSKISGFNEITVNKKFNFDGTEFFFEFKDLPDDVEEEKRVDFTITCVSLNDNKSI
jgi:GTPase SAR1 family protein